LEKQICKNCGRDCIKHAKGMCVTCYKKLAWKPKPKECKRCKRILTHHAKGLCAGCYQTVFQLENNKNHNYKKWYNISIDLYKKITKKCLLCGFDKVVDLHHLDKNKKNNSESNLIGLCPNHHRMIHQQKYRQEILEKVNEILVKKGIKPVEKRDTFFMNNPRK
jgi:hypothetical protein